MRKKILTEEENRQLAETYQQTKSTYATAEKLGLDRNLVYRRLKQLGVVVDGLSGPRDKLKIDEDYFSEIDTEEKAYWLGFIAADGNVRKNKQGSWIFQLHLGIEDKDHLFKLRECLKSDAKIGLRDKDCQLVIVRKKLCFDLMKHGVVPRKTFVLRFPYHLDKKMIQHYIRGYFDGDGCWHIRKRRIVKQLQFSIVSASEDFLSEVDNQINEFCKIKNCHLRKNRTMYEMKIEGNLQCKRIFDYLYNDATIYLDRKFLKAKKVLVDD